MSVVLLGLGPFRFSITGLNYTQLSRQFEYRWEAQARIGRRPAHQFLGPGVEQITLQGTIFPHYMGGLGQLERMRSDAQRGTTFRLGSGYGMNFGTFCIKQITDEHSHIHKSGAPLKVTFQIQLVAYGEDQLGLAAGLAFAALDLEAAGDAQSAPVPSPAPILPGGVGAQPY